MSEYDELPNNAKYGPPDPGSPSAHYDHAAPWQVAPEPPLAPHRRLRRSTSVAVATSLLAATGLGVGLGNIAWRPKPATSATSLTSSAADVAQIAKAVDPALVDIVASSSYSDAADAGTGIVLTSTGEVVTNNHVIDGSTSVKVRDVGNGKTYTARVVGYDRTQDVAVLQIEGASGLTTANIASSAQVSSGASVVGIGNAGGTGGTPSYAAGAVTALDQSITASDQGTGTSEQLTGLIETDADIQPGDSGGPLVDASGQVVGMDTAAASTSGVGESSATSTSQSYAIPISKVISIAQQIVSGSASSTVHIGATAFLGIAVDAASSGSVGGFGSFGGGFGGYGGYGGGLGSTSGASTAAGAEIADVLAGTPAARAGLAAGDTITALGGHTVTSASSLTSVLTTEKVGTAVRVTYTDSLGTSETVTLTLVAGPAQ